MQTRAKYATYYQAEKLSFQRLVRHPFIMLRLPVHLFPQHLANKTQRYLSQKSRLISVETWPSMCLREGADLRKVAA